MWRQNPNSSSARPSHWGYTHHRGFALKGTEYRLCLCPEQSLKFQTANRSQIAKFMGPTWGPPGCCRPQMGPMLSCIPLYQFEFKAAFYIFLFFVMDVRTRIRRKSCFSGFCSENENCKQTDTWFLHGFKLLNILTLVPIILCSIFIIANATIAHNVHTHNNHMAHLSTICHVHRMKGVHGICDIGFV